MKRVCIIGAGPAGLVAAKTCIQSGHYKVTVFEAADRVGGMWRARSGENGDKCSPDMKTNLSRFTVAFIDLHWSSVDLSESATQTLSPVPPPTFPKAWQVGRYLETYARKFHIPDYLQLNKRVINAKLLGDHATWQVTVADSVTLQESTWLFDRLIVASGFFGKPGGSFDPSPNQDLTCIQHSSRFRELSSLTGRPGKIVVIGGSISGSEAAAHAAFQISSAKHSPGNMKLVHAESQIYHIINRPFYCLPRHLPQNPHNGDPQKFNLAPRFLPIDLVLYDLSRRADGEISATITTVPTEKAEKGHAFMRSLIGGDQSELGQPALVYRQPETQIPGYTGITDTYSEFVRSGIIVPVQGWVDKVMRRPGRGFDVALKHRKPWSHIKLEEDEGDSNITDVVAIIEATGYTPDLDFLDISVKERLNYDDSCPRIPFLLSRGSTLAPQIPTLGFVGYYEGPYWAVMEMQARFIAQLWADLVPLKEVDFQRAIFQHHDAERMRQAMSERSLQVPQFWMMDYVGLVEEFVRELPLWRIDIPFGGQVGPSFPARYFGYETDENSTITEVTDLIKASNENAKFVAAAVFRGMQGIWTLQRQIESGDAASPPGTLSGVAHFYPRTPTDPTYAAEYLYAEDGTFTMTTGSSFPVMRRYIYRYNETTDKISVWFPAEDNVSVGALFTTWYFYHPVDQKHGWMAMGSHGHKPDEHTTSCDFRFQGASVNTFGITYRVHGRGKDYAHKSWYTRPKVEDG